MSEDGLRREIKRLVAECERLRADLAAERGQAAVGEIVVTRHAAHPPEGQLLRLTAVLTPVDVMQRGGEDVIDLCVRRLGVEARGYARRFTGGDGADKR